MQQEQIQSTTSPGRYKTSKHPPARQFTLTVNYRSHGGIVDCAASVVRIISSLWPETIDNIGEERARVPGAKPIFFGHDDGEAAYEQFIENAA
jgi:hypothetical protein